MKLEPLDPAIAQLLESERATPKAAPDAAAAIARAMAKGDAILAAAGPATSTQNQTPTAPGKYGWRAVAAGVAGGAVIGSLVTYALLAQHPSAPIPTPVIAPIPSGSSSAIQAPTAAASVSPAISAEPSPTSSARAAPTAHAAVDSTQQRPNDIAKEREIVDAARAALAKGNMAEAARLLREHDKEFPRGQLGEERDALQIIALARGGKKEQARTLFSAFKRAHGSSPLIPMLEAETGGTDAPP
jgi:hypothetical protein